MEGCCAVQRRSGTPEKLLAVAEEPRFRPVRNFGDSRSTEEQYFLSQNLLAISQEKLTAKP